MATRSKTISLLFLVSVCGLSCTVSNSAHLADVDVRLRADQARRDYVLETDRKAQAQGLSTIRGRWETPTETTTLDYHLYPLSHGYSPYVQVPLLDAFYSDDEGLILRFAFAVQCATDSGSCRCIDPLKLFDVYDSLGREPKQCFASRPQVQDDCQGNEIGDNGRILVLKVSLTDKCKQEALTIAPSRMIIPARASVVGSVPLWVYPPADTKPSDGDDQSSQE